MLALAGEIAELAGDQVGPSEAADVRAVADWLSDQPYQVVACGEFKRGKSSLLNAIVGRRQLFPTGPELITAAVMTLRWGPKPRAVTRTRTPEGVVDEEIPFDDLSRWVSASPDAQAWRIAQVDVEFPLDRLTSGVILVDTPGIGGVDGVHSGITLDFLPGADAVVVVLSADQPATTSELDFVKLALAKQPAVIFALAMTDRVLDVERRLEATRARLSGYLGTEPEDLDILPVSAAEAWNAVRTNDAVRLAASGLPALENEIWTTLIAQAGARRLRNAMAGLLLLAKRASAPIASELTALAGPDELAAVLAELAADEQSLLAAREGLADRGQLEQDFAARVGEIEQDFRDRIDKVLSDLDLVATASTGAESGSAGGAVDGAGGAVDGAGGAVDGAGGAVDGAAADGAERATAERLAQLIKTADDARSSAFGALRECAVTVANEWERRTTQPLRVLDLSPQAGLELPGPPEPVRQRVQFGSIVKVGTTVGGALSASLATVGGAIGSFFPGSGTAVGAALGGAVGNILGFLGGAIDHVRSANTRARARQLRSYAQQLRGSIADFRSDALSRFEDTQLENLQYLKLQIRRLNQTQLQAIKQARARVEESARADAERRAARVAELQLQSMVIKGYGERLRDLGRRLSALEADIRRRPDRQRSGSGDRDQVGGVRY